MLPDGWKEVKLGEAVSFLDGKRKPLKSEDRLKIRGQYPYYGATGIIDYVNDYIFDDTLILMGEDGENIISRNLPHVFIISGKTWVNNHAHVLKAKKYCDAHFLSSYLESLNYEKYNTGSAQPKLNKAICESIRVLLPPLPEQKKIAAILSTWDRAIEGTEKLLANSQQQKKALMQQLLTGKKRLPGFTGEWKFHTLSELAAMSSGGTPLSTQKAYFGGNIPWVSIADMTRCGKYISQTEKTLTKSGLDNSSAKLYPKNTVLYAMYASIGECSIASTELSCSQAILGIRTNSKLYFEYLYFYLGFLKEKIKLLGQTGTQSNLNAKMVKAFRINLPPLPEQKAIAAVLSTSDEEITALESDLARLRQEKKALMQKLLTGKRRVKVD